MNFNFELILFYATLVTGIIVLIDKLFFAKKRNDKHKKLPIIIDYARSFFPVLLLVFLLRSFLFEPFRIPSGSLEPTLLTGDFILVNKYAYGVRLPVSHNKILDNNLPARGDILVFRWPPNPGYDFIKRVIGVPGDKIDYIDKVLYVNNVPVKQEFIEAVEARSEAGDKVRVNEKKEYLPGVAHFIYMDPQKASHDFHRIIVPPHMYFVMGDNRDDSADSRFWGFVPEENIVGKAVLVWLSWDHVNKKIRFNRFGTVINS